MIGEEIITGTMPAWPPNELGMVSSQHVTELLEDRPFVNAPKRNDEDRAARATN
jgi:hypothetical protein